MTIYSNILGMGFRDGFKYLAALWLTIMSLLLQASNGIPSLILMKHYILCLLIKRYIMPQ